MGQTCAGSRGEYVAILDDIPEGWSISNTLSMIGLGAIAPGARPKTPVIDPEAAKEMFTKLYALSFQHAMDNTNILQTWNGSCGFVGDL